MIWAPVTSASFGCRSGDDLLLVALALAPGLQDQAAETLTDARRAIDEEDVILLGDRIGGRLNLPCRVFHIVEIGILRRLDQGEDRALIFLGRELLRAVEANITPVSARTPTRIRRVMARKFSVLCRRR